MLVDNKAIFGCILYDEADIASELENIRGVCGSHGKALSILQCSDKRTILGIISPQHSAAPTNDPPHKVSIVSVGNVFNKSELTFPSESGVEARSDGDLLRMAYAKYGDKLFSRLNGTYGVALWDSENGKLLLACDQQSDTHLYYRIGKTGLWFSSWMKLLTAQTTEIDPDGVLEFLRFFYLAPPRTIFKNISRLEHGNYLKFEKRTATVQSYLENTDVDVHVASENKNKQTLVTDFETILFSSIHKRFDNRKVGIFLSGGIDSAVIAAGCHKLFPNESIAYTVGFDDSALDETSCATTLAGHLGMPHRIVHFTLKQYCNALEEMSHTFDQPFGDPACLPVLLTCQKTKNEVEVMTGGSGGDDLFGSHVERHVAVSLLIDKLMNRKTRNFFQKMLEGFPSSKVSRYGSLFAFADPEELYIMWNGWSRPDLTHLMGHTVDLSQSTFYKIFRRYREFGAQRLHDQLHFLPPEDSRLESAGACGFSYHMPYHDIDVLKFVRSLPREERYTKYEAKVLLRALYRKHFPISTWGVRKHTFNIPLVQILKHDNYGLIHKYLSKQSIQNAGLVPPENACEWVRRFLQGDQSLILKMYSLLVLHCWHFHR